MVVHVVLRLSETRLGDFVFAVVPLPSCPWSFSPQHQELPTLPMVPRTQVYACPAVTEVQLVTPDTVAILVGVSRWVVSPVPGLAVGQVAALAVPPTW
jgi:hypothetical protein